MGGNANSGRRPQPTALRMLRGNPGKRKPKADEPQPPRADPSFDAPPPELTDQVDALAEWSRVVPLLRVCGVISNAERSILIALCLEWAKYLRAGRDVAAGGMVVARGSTGVQVNPALRIADHALVHCRAIWIELGLTPAGRAKLSTLPALPASPPPVGPGKWDGQL